MFYMLKSNNTTILLKKIVGIKKYASRKIKNKKETIQIFKIDWLNMLWNISTNVDVTLLYFLYVCS